MLGGQCRVEGLGSDRRHPLAVLVLDTGLSDRQILRRQLATDEAETLAHRRLAGATAAHERIQGDAAGRGDQAQQVGHQVRRFDGGVVVGGNPRSAVAVSRHRAGRVQF
ncbi:hypothetical protein D3C81_847810 [compost metagenome]